MGKSKNLFLIVALLSVFTSYFAFSTQANITNAKANEENNVVIENLNKDTVYNYIDGPHIITGSDVDFFVCDKNNYIYHFRNNELTLESTQFTDIVDMQYYNNLLYILTSTKLVKYNAGSKTYNDVLTEKITSPVGVYINEYGYFVANQTSIIYKNNQNNNIIEHTTYELDLQAPNFLSIKDIYISNDYIINVIHSSSTSTIISEYKLDDTYSAFNHQKSEIIYSQSPLPFSLSIYNNTRMISYDNKLYYTNNILDSSSPILSSQISNTSYISGEVKNISSFTIHGDKVIVCDNNPMSNSIQSFKIQDGKLVFDRILVASCGADDDRLFNPTDTCLYDNENILILDSGNHRVIKNNIEAGTNEKVIDIKSAILLDSNTLGEIYILTNDINKQYLYIYKSINDKNPTKIKISNYEICDLEISTTNKIYLLDKTKKLLLTLNENYEIIELLQLSELSFTSSAKIKTDASGNTVYILADNIIYSTQLNQEELKCDTKLQIERGNIIDFVIDYKNYIYCLNKQSSNYSIEKYSSSSNFITSVNIENDEEFSSLYLNLTSGILYSINPTLNKIISIQIKNYINALHEYENDYSFRENYPTTGADFAKVNQECQTFKYPFNVEPIQSLEKDDMVIVISRETKDNKNFAYILIANKEHANILAYIDTALLDYNVEEEKLDFDEIVITASSGAYFYYFPTGEQFEDKQTCSVPNRKANVGDTYKVIGLAHGYTDYSGMNYYTVQLDTGEIFYIKERYAQNADILKPSITLQADARVEKILSSDIIYIYQYNEETKEYERTDITLKNGQYIQLLDSYDSQSPYLHIKYQYDEKTLLEGYVETKFVVYEDLTWLRIVGIVLLILSIILIVISINLVYHFMKKRTINKIDYEQINIDKE